MIPLVGTVAMPSVRTDSIGLVQNGELELAERRVLPSDVSLASDSKSHQ